MVKHIYTIFDWLDALKWDRHIYDEIIARYYLKASNDLRMTIFEYRGIRLRDIKSIFQQRAGYALNLEKLQLKSWTAFLIQMHMDLEFRKDLVKDEVLVYLSLSGAMKLGLDSINEDTVRITTPVINAYVPQAQNLVVCDPRDVFFGGYLDVSDGVPMVDPRVPSQEQKANFKKPDKTVVTCETTAPLRNTQKGSLKAVMEMTQRTSHIAPESSIMQRCNMFGDYCPQPTRPAAKSSGSVSVLPVTTDKVETVSWGYKSTDSSDDW